MTEKFIVLDPTLEVETPRVENAPRPTEIHVIGLLDNGKPNSGKLLKEVAEMLVAQHPDVKVNYYRKQSAYRPAPAPLIDQVAAECDVALVGIGD